MDKEWLLQGPIQVKGGYKGLCQHVRLLKALVRTAGRPVGNPGTAGEKHAQLWVVAVGADRVQRSWRPQDSSGGDGGSELAWTWN